MRAEFLPEAGIDAEQATRYYEQCVPGLGARFRGEVERTCAAIVSQPLIWRERHGGHRRANIPGFPYYIAFFHTRRALHHRCCRARRTSSRLLERTPRLMAESLKKDSAHCCRSE